MEVDGSKFVRRRACSLSATSQYILFGFGRKAGAHSKQHSSISNDPSKAYEFARDLDNVVLEWRRPANLRLGVEVGSEKNFGLVLASDGERDGLILDDA